MFLAQAINWERFLNKEINKWKIKLHTWNLKGKEFFSAMHISLC